MMVFLGLRLQAWLSPFSVHSLNAVGKYHIVPIRMGYPHQKAPPSFFVSLVITFLIWGRKVPLFFFLFLIEVHLTSPLLHRASIRNNMV
jgi:hypothetical protein